MTESIMLNPYQPNIQPLLIVISGPSGVGKDSIVQRMKERGTAFHFVVTATSRPARVNEINGVDYFFISETEFKSLIEQDELLEYALVYEQYKGIPKDQVRQALASGKDVVMRLDVQGAATIKKMFPDAVLIFLSATSEKELIRRLRARRMDTEEQLRRRIDTAKGEMDTLPIFDYTIINADGQLDKAVDQILSIIQAEHNRVQQRCIKL